MYNVYLLLLSSFPIIYMFIYLSIYLSIYLTVYLTILLSIFLTTYLSYYLSILLSIYLSIYTSRLPWFICLHFCEQLILFYNLFIQKNRNKIIEYQLPCNFGVYSKVLSYLLFLSYNSYISLFLKWLIG